MLYLTGNMIFFVLIEWAELFLYIDLTKKKSSKKKWQNLNIVFSNLPW
jgi:hypothetical protein